MRTGQHYCPETLLAGMDTALAKLVILASAVLAQEERPFQTPFLAPAHKSPSTGGFFYGVGLSGGRDANLSVPRSTLRPHSLYRRVKNCYAWIEKAPCFLVSSKVQYSNPKYEKEPF